MIEKLKHGTYIESAKLNEIIDALNKIEEDHETVKEIKNSVNDTLSNINTRLSSYAEQIGENIESIPALNELYASILLARDSVDWVDLNSDFTDNQALIDAELLEDTTNINYPSTRLKIIRGTDDEVNMNTPEKVDKQILISYTITDGVVTRGIMYLDFYDKASDSVKRCPISSNANIDITASAPTLSFNNEDGDTKLVITNPDGSTEESGSLIGPAGAPGSAGPIGPMGPQGERGLQGERGYTGQPGEKGATPKIRLFFSDNQGGTYSEVYSNQTYMGIKLYDDQMTLEEVNAQPTRWIRLKGDTLYPHYDQVSGLLTFSTTPMNQSEFRVKGDQGPIGPAGPAPIIKFQQEDGTVISLTSTEDNDGTYIYDASLFTGEKGDTGDIGPQGPIGEPGPKPLITFIAETTNELTASVEDVTPFNSTYDYVYKLKIPKGLDGRSIASANVLYNGEVLLNMTSGNPISLGILKGDKGDKGDPATISIKGACLSTSELPVSTSITPPEVGNAYTVTTTNGGVTRTELYICVDSTQNTYSTCYRNLGNIKGDAGTAGTKWHCGTAVSDNNPTILGNTFNTNDLYLNTETSDIYRLTHPTGQAEGTFTPMLLCNIKGETGERGLAGPNGNDGAAGRGISSIAKTGINNNIDTYTITYTDNTTSVFTITNGEDGINGLNGQDGEDGTKILTGASTPLDASGIDNDIYIDYTTGNLYIKSESTWGLPRLCIKGTNGTNGIDGSRSPGIYSILSSTLPGFTNYIVGDTIILSTFAMYKLTENEQHILQWQEIGSIKGPQGTVGATGRSSRVFKMTSNDNKFLNTASESTVQHNQNNWYNGLFSDSVSPRVAQGDIAINMLNGDSLKGTAYVCTAVIEGSNQSTWSAITSQAASSLALQKSTINTGGAQVLTITPNVKYILTSSTLSSLSLTLGSQLEDVENVYQVVFTIPSTAGSFNVTILPSVTYADGFDPSIDYVPGKKYILTIEDNIAFVASVTL